MNAPHPSSLHDPVDSPPAVTPIGVCLDRVRAARVAVSDTPWFRRSAENGRTRAANVPAGDCVLRLRHPGVAPGSEPAPLLPVLGDGEAEQNARSNVDSEP